MLGVLKNKRSSKDESGSQNFVVVNKDGKSRKKYICVDPYLFDKYLKNKSITEIIKETKRLKEEKRNKQDKK
jgi:hypothetical protein